LTNDSVEMMVASLTGRSLNRCVSGDTFSMVSV
jgi:hypothetical protein